MSFTSKAFQFTPLREGRLYCDDGFITLYRISIHAPPRGATQPTSQPTSTISHFNSRPSARGDTRAIRAILQSQDFNSRPSARGD